MTDSENPDLRSRVTELLEDGKFNEVISLLNSAGRLDSHLKGLEALAHYMLGEYKRSAQLYAQVLEEEPDDTEVREMLKKAELNAQAELSVFVPDVYFFEKEPLLAPRSNFEPDLPVPLPRAPQSGKWPRTRLIIGNVSGYVLSWISNGLTQIYGRLAGFRDNIWTNWYRRPIMLGLLTLAYMRERINKNNLFSAYPEDVLIGFQSSGQQPPVGSSHFRTADGSWNNLMDPMEGAAGTRFHRNVNASSVRNATDRQLMTPNPREISRIFLTRKGSMKEVTFLNMLAVAWIQFQTHDWVSHGEPLTNKFHEIPLSNEDPARKRYYQSKIFVGRTQPDPTKREGDPFELAFINEVTHWWDGSQLYGSDQKTVDHLRAHVDGKLRISPGGTLPRDDKGIEETGYVRNWWVGLSLMHTLFTREHNAICEHLKENYPVWDDNRLFHVARLINAALMAKIQTIEWNSAINPNKALEKGNHSNWYGMLTNLLRKEESRKTVADINVRNPELGGVVGNPIDKHGSPYGLTQEFVEVYRLHSLLPEELRIRSPDGKISEDIPFSLSRQAGSGKIIDRIGISNLFYSFGNQNPGQLVLNNFPRFMQELSIPGNPVYDLGAVDILRSRERGVPRYNEFRRQMGLHPISSFDDLTTDSAIAGKLGEVYGSGAEGVEMLDLMIGTLAESHRPKGFAFGETMFQIFLLNATRRLQADRFYTDCYTEEYYTKEGFLWIDKNDLKSVILRHYPELGNTGLANVKNAFEPWDMDTILDPLRHPLAFF